MRILAPAALLVCTLVAACGSPTPAPAPSPTATAATGDAARVTALAPPLRAGVLLRAIRDAGQDCQQVVAQAQLKPAVWIATCQDKRRWVVTIGPNGNATVADANDVARMH